MPPGDAKCPHGFTITGLCPKCDPKAYYQAVLDFLSKPTPLLGLPTADSYGVTGLSDAIDQQAKNPLLWTPATADTPGGEFSYEQALKYYGKKFGKVVGLDEGAEFIPFVPPTRDRGVHQIGFMSEADVAEVRRLIGVTP